MTVLRIETSNGTGPYIGAPESLTNAYRECHWIPASHPNGSSDGMYPTYEHSYGFKNIAQFHTWFNKKERKLLHKYNYEIVTYRMLRKHMDYSDKQAIFEKEYSKAVKRQPII